MRRSRRDGVFRPRCRTADQPLLTFDATWSAVKDHVPPVDLDSDEGLKAILRRELIEIACFNGVSDPETLRDILLTRLPPARLAP
jgi:hypothetical protein